MDKLDIIVKKDFENKLLGRREIAFDLIYAESTPSRERVKEELSKKLNLDPKLTVIVKINQLYGIPKSEALAYYYKDEASMKVEPKFRIERSKKQKEGAGAEQGSEQKAADEAK